MLRLAPRLQFLVCSLRTLTIANHLREISEVSVGTCGLMRWHLTALCIGLVGVAGSVWLSMGMGLKACPLCLYQRTFIMGVVGVLTVGVLTPVRSSALLAGLSLPAAVGGLGVALFHEYLELSGKLECPDGLLGLGTAPQQSLVVFVLLVAALGVAASRRHKAGGFGVPAMITALGLGLLCTVGTIISAPPLPATPTTPYEGPPDMCRPAYHATQPEL